MTGLLQRDPSKRLGANGGEEIKRHPFFAKYIDWNRYVSLPRVLSNTDGEKTSNKPSCQEDSASLQT